MAYLKGADLAHYQGVIDFSVVKDKLNFVIIKATEGTTGFDQNYNTYLKGARANGLQVGHYHFAHPEFNAASSEALWFLSKINLANGEILCLDYENMNYVDPVVWCLTFLQTIAAKLNGYKPLIYLNKSLITGHDWSPVIKNNNGLWLADYVSDEVATTYKCAWPTIAIRQWSNAAVVPGIQNKVDADTFYGDSNTFSKYGIQGVTMPDSTGGLPANYGDIIKKSTQWDIVCTAQNLGDPVAASADTLVRSIAGLNARITDLTSQLGLAQGQVANDAEIISRLNGVVLADQVDQKALQVKLDASNATVTQLGKDKGNLVIANQTMQIKIDTLQAQLSQGVVTLTIGDIINLLLKQKITISNKKA